MTSEQRIAQLEADLAREREEKAELRALVRSFQARMDLETSQKASRKARNDRHRTVDVSVRVSRDVSRDVIETSRHLPPPLKGSPPLPDPISPSPISSPPSSSGPANPAFHERLSEAHMRHRGSVLPWDSRRGNAEHIALVNLATAGGKSGGAAEDEVVRRFDYMLQRQDIQFEPGRHKGTTLAELLRPECWGANAKPPLREQPRPAAPEPWLPPGAPTAQDRANAHKAYLAREAAKKAAGGAT